MNFVLAFRGIFRGAISHLRLALSCTLGSSASGCAVAALSASLADSMLVVPLARASAVSDFPHLCTSMPES